MKSVSISSINFVKFLFMMSKYGLTLYSLSYRSESPFFSEMKKTLDSFPVERQET